MAEKDAVRRAYDELAAAYAAQRDQSGRGQAVLASFLDSAAPERVLDAGCGQGTPVLDRLAETTAAVGLDASRRQLCLAADRVPDASLLQGDMVRLPFTGGAFDAAVAYWSLIHVPLDEQPTALAEFARVLRPGGRLLVCEGREAWVGENPDWLDTGVEMAWEIAGVEATRETLRETGFTVVEEWGVPDSLADEPPEGEAPWVFLDAQLER